MFPSPKSYAKNPLPAGDDVLLTATAPTIVGSVVGTTTNGVERTGRVGIKRAGSPETTWVSRDIAVALGSSANLVPAKLSMEIGDSLIVNAVGQSIGQKINSVSCWPSTPILLLSNADGTKIVGVNIWGIYLSEDGQVTARQVYGELPFPYGNVGAFFTGKFRIYTSDTSSLTSSDGITWAVEVCINAPTNKSTSALGGFIFKGTELYGSTTGQLKKSTDGLVFTNHGTSLNTDCSFTWTGTNWVSKDTAATPLVKYSTEAATVWTSSTGYGALTTQQNPSLESLGGTVLATGGNGLAAISKDHGVTFTATSWTYQTFPTLVSAGGRFVIATSLREYEVSSFGGFTSNGSTEGFINQADDTVAAFSVNSGGLIYPNVKSVDPALSRRGGFTVTANVLEMLP